VGGRRGVGVTGGRDDQGVGGVGETGGGDGVTGGRDDKGVGGVK
jgi:hypothetical protein